MAEIKLSANQRRYTRNDKTTLLQLFPIEIWLKITQAMRSEHVTNLCCSSLFFQSLIQPQRTSLLFGTVIKHVILHMPCLPSESVRGFNESRITGMPQTAGQIFQICRLACSSWANAVDKVFQNASHHINTQLEYLDGAPQLPGYITFGSVKLENFMELTQTDKSIGVSHVNKNINPFPGRHISVIYDITETPDPGYNDFVEQLLEAYGHHVGYFNLTLSTDQFGNYRGRVKRILQFLPKLKAFTLHLMPGKDSDKELSALKTEYPHIRTLQYVRTSGQHVLFFLEDFVRSNPHVKGYFGCDATYTYRHPCIDYPYADY